jgi:hypothetical protein
MDFGRQADAEMGPKEIDDAQSGLIMALWMKHLILSRHCRAAGGNPPPGAPFLLEQLQDQLRVLVGDRQRLDAKLLLSLQRL